MIKSGCKFNQIRQICFYKISHETVKHCMRTTFTDVLQKELNHHTLFFSTDTSTLECSAPPWRREKPAMMSRAEAEHNEQFKGLFFNQGQQLNFHLFKYETWPIYAHVINLYLCISWTINDFEQRKICFLFSIAVQLEIFSHPLSKRFQIYFFVNVNISIWL